MKRDAMLHVRAGALVLLAAILTLAAAIIEVSGILHGPDMEKTEGTVSGDTGGHRQGDGTEQTIKTSNDSDSGPLGNIRSDLTAMTAEQGCPDQTLAIRNLLLVPTPASPESGGLHGAWAEVTLTVTTPSQAVKFLRFKGNGQGSDEASATALAGDRLLENVAQRLEELSSNCAS